MQDYTFTGEHNCVYNYVPDTIDALIKRFSLPENTTVTELVTFFGNHKALESNLGINKYSPFFTDNTTGGRYCTEVIQKIRKMDFNALCALPMIQLIDRFVGAEEFHKMYSAALKLDFLKINHLYAPFYKGAVTTKSEEELSEEELSDKNLKKLKGLFGLDLDIKNRDLYKFFGGKKAANANMGKDIGDCVFYFKGDSDDDHDGFYNAEVIQAVRRSVTIAAATRTTLYITTAPIAALIDLFDNGLKDFKEVYKTMAAAIGSYKRKEADMPKEEIVYADYRESDQRVHRFRQDLIEEVIARFSLPEDTTVDELVKFFGNVKAMRSNMIPVHDAPYFYHTSTSTFYHTTGVQKLREVSFETLKAVPIDELIKIFGGSKSFGAIHYHQTNNPNAKLDTDSFMWNYKEYVKKQEYMKNQAQPEVQKESNEAPTKEQLLALVKQFNLDDYLKPDQLNKFLGNTEDQLTQVYDKWIPHTFNKALYYNLLEAFEIKDLKFKEVVSFFGNIECLRHNMTNPVDHMYFTYFSNTKGSKWDNFHAQSVQVIRELIGENLVGKLSISDLISKFITYDNFCALYNDVVLGKSGPLVIGMNRDGTMRGELRYQPALDVQPTKEIKKFITYDKLPGTKGQFTLFDYTQLKEFWESTTEPYAGLINLNEEKYSFKELTSVAKTIRLYSTAIIQAFKTVFGKDYDTVIDSNSILELREFCEELFTGKLVTKTAQHTYDKYGCLATEIVIDFQPSA
jgi:hypothetical protein